MKRTIEWLDAELDPINREIAYPLDKAKSRYEVREICKEGYLILNKKPFYEGDTSGWLKFAVMSWFGSNLDDSDVLLKCLFHGDGPYGVLREPRHFYFGDGDGYLFYPEASVIQAGFEALKEFYDFQ